MAAEQAATAGGQRAERPEHEHAPPAPDLSGWWAAAGHVPAAQGRATGDVNLANAAREAPDGRDVAPPGHQASAPPLPRAPVDLAPRRSGWRPVAHVWAFVKMALVVWTVEWALALVHAHLAEDVCVYGLTCIFAGVGARWSKRFFGPAQVVEPELYGEIGRWLYRAGACLVLVGGVLDLIGQLH